MPVHSRHTTPTGHGEVLCSPPFSTWRALAEANAEASKEYPEELASLRADARREALERAVVYSAALDIDAEPGHGPLVAMTGHQPELYHPGVWVKDFLLQRFADETGAHAIDLVVDTDATCGVELKVPCLDQTARVCSVPLAPQQEERAYAHQPVPTADEIAAFRVAGTTSLATLPAPALLRHFHTFCAALEESARISSDLGAAVTGARRRYERPAATSYLELGLLDQSTTAAFRRFAATLLTDAQRFREVFNSELAAYRLRAGVRSLAQPFPDLAERDGRFESPFWMLSAAGRATASVDARGVLYADGERVCALGTAAHDAAHALQEAQVSLAPKAVALTLFERLFVADLFVHGTGGGRYDRVTDAVIASYYGVRPPAFAVASMTLLLPLGGRVTTDEEVAAVEQRLQRLEHNPDQVLAEVEFDTPEERTLADRLAADKRRLVREIAAAGADKKTLGLAIRETNSALRRLLEPLADELAGELERVRAARDATAVLTDRTYPFCLWDPLEVMDKVR